MQQEDTATIASTRCFHRKTVSIGYELSDSEAT